MKSLARVLVVAMLVVATAWIAGCKPQEQAAAPTPPKPMKPGYPEPAVVKACAAAPVIDGDLSDACWKTAEVAGTWVDVGTGRAVKPEGKVLVCYDAKNIYVAYLNPEPKMKDLVANATERDGNLWEDDSNELFLDPSAGKKDYFQFIVNASNVMYDGKGKDGTWNSTAKSAVKKTADGWSVEIAVPLAELGAAVPLKGKTWTANFCRNRRVEVEPQSSAWCDTGSSFHNPEAFGKLKME